MKKVEPLSKWVLFYWDINFDKGYIILYNLMVQVSAFMPWIYGGGKIQERRGLYAYGIWKFKRKRIVKSNGN